MLLYNHPGRVGYGLTAEMVDCLAHEVPNICGMKDTSGDITLTEECVRRAPYNSGFFAKNAKNTLSFRWVCTVTCEQSVENLPSAVTGE